MINRLPEFLKCDKDGYPYSVKSHVNLPFISLKSDNNLGELSFLIKSLVSQITQSTFSVMNKNLPSFIMQKRCMKQYSC